MFALPPIRKRSCRQASLLILIACTLPFLSRAQTDNFDGDGELIGYTTNNASVLPIVKRANGRYRALLEDNANNKTLHFHQSQGRLDAKLASFPFEYIARNIGIGTTTDSQIQPEHSTSPAEPYIFCGIQVHALDLNEPNSSHVVVGHRGGVRSTIEGKNTTSGNSSVNDDGFDALPLGRGDIKIVGTKERTLIVSWQQPNLTGDPKNDNFQLYRGSGQLPGTAPAYEEQVYIGLITYAYGENLVPFVGTCDAIEFRSLATEMPIADPRLEFDKTQHILHNFRASPIVDGQAYLLQHSSDLKSWETLESFQATASQDTHRFETQTVLPQIRAYYRLRLEPTKD